MDFKDVPKTEYIDPRENKALQVQEFLKKMGIIESNSGTNIEHKEMNSGIHKGSSAVGEYGMMPLTAKLYDKKSGVNELADLSKEEVQAKLEQDPEFAKRMSETMASDLLNKNNSELAAYKWEHGPYAKPTDSDLKDSGRIRKFRSLSRLK
jgi:hypothetical protein